VSDITTINALIVNNRRAIRARYPNGDPDTTGLHTIPTGYIEEAEAWLAPQPYPFAQEIHLTPQRDNSLFPEFQLGIGGSGAEFIPQESFWTTKSPPAGDRYIVPGGMKYRQGTFSNKTWANPATGTSFFSVCHTISGCVDSSWDCQIRLHPNRFIAYIPFRTLGQLDLSTLGSFTINTYINIFTWWIPRSSW
jgi:hypothetical protein